MISSLNEWKNNFEDKVGWILGDVNRIKFWEDKWIEDETLSVRFSSFSLFRFLKQQISHRQGSEVMINETESWSGEDLYFNGNWKRKDNLCNAQKATLYERKRGFMGLGGRQKVRVHGKICIQDFKK